MNNRDLIESGELELYVAGLLDEDRAQEITTIIQQDESVRKEIEEIEKTVLDLAQASTNQEDFAFTEVLKKVIVSKDVSSEKEKADFTITPKERTWRTYVIWAAAAVFLVMFILQYQNSEEVTNQLNLSLEEKKELNTRVEQQNFKLQYKDDLLATLASPATETVQLAGQEVSPESAAQVFWNKKLDQVVIDASQLPSPPEGKVYQVWSLKLEPLTPTSLGLLEGISQTDQLFLLNNPNSSEAFGITLEPEGGSESPTLEQLYVLGIYES